jgi:hypothetical protein
MSCNILKYMFGAVLVVCVVVIAWSQTSSTLDKSSNESIKSSSVVVQPANVNSHSESRVNNLVVNDHLNSELRNALNQNVKLSIKQKTLLEICEILRKDYKLDVSFDKKPLDASYFDYDATFDCDMDSMPLKKGLQIILSQYDLTYCIRNNKIIITIHTAVYNMSQPIVYDLSSVLQSDSNSINTKADTIAKCIIELIDPPIWKENGGQSVISVIDTKTIGVLTTIHCHDQIQDFLEDLIKAKQQQLKYDNKPIK